MTPKVVGVDGLAMLVWKFRMRIQGELVPTAKGDPNRARCLPPGISGSCRCVPVWVRCVWLVGKTWGGAVAGR